ncbi:dihydroxyacetone kinase subunit DhaK [Blautia schinkii]|nr:dihydroxyacetone kinase subunit DhaK [Blautia schinkii]
MKKIINKPEQAVMEMCRGIAQANPSVELITKYKVIKKKEINPSKVSLISGGGSGHEPAHAGFVGKGMLDAAVCGDVFASPSQIQVYQALRATASEKGTLMIIKNYSGDMMNFKNAAHLAAEDGIQVDYVKVDDDIAVEDSLYTVGHRGVAGTVLVHKITGAAAEAGAELSEVKRIAQKAIDHVKSIGFAFSSCTVPAKGTPTFELGEDEMEYGVGIHGEPGISREKAASADELADRMTDSLLKELNMDGDSQEEIAVLVNGFGATPLQELYILNNSVMKRLKAHGVKASRVYVGNYMTSIDMEGASLTFMKLDQELKGYLTAPSQAPGFPVFGDEKDVSFVCGAEEETISRESSFTVETAPECSRIKNNKLSLGNIVYMVDKMAEVIINNEVPFCELDSHAGDGDFGMSVAKGFRQLKREWPEIIENGKDSIGSFLQECAIVIMEYCGGASGPIWGSAFRAAGRIAGDRMEVSVSEFAEIMQAAVKGIQETGARSFGRGAVVGDKTLIDALVPCADIWSEASPEDSVKTVMTRAAQAAVAGAKKTEEIVARMGRAGTVGERSIGYPDAGAYGLGVIFTDVAEAMSE